MIILKIFRLKKQIKNIKDGINNPSDFASKNIINILTTYIIIAVIIDLIILTILFLLGYTNIIIKPIGLARFLFWLDLFLTIPVGIFIIFILSKIKIVSKVLKENIVKREPIKVDSKIVEPAFLEK